MCFRRFKLVDMLTLFDMYETYVCVYDFSFFYILLVGITKEINDSLFSKYRCYNKPT